MVALSMIYLPLPLDLDLITHTITQFETIDAVCTSTYYKLLDIIYLHHI